MACSYIVVWLFEVIVVSKDYPERNTEGASIDQGADSFWCQTNWYGVTSIIELGEKWCLMLAKHRLPEKLTEADQAVYSQRKPNSCRSANFLANSTVLCVTYAQLSLIRYI